MSPGEKGSEAGHENTSGAVACSVVPMTLGQGHQRFCCFYFVKVGLMMWGTIETLKGCSDLMDSYECPCTHHRPFR